MAAVDTDRVGDDSLDDGSGLEALQVGGCSKWVAVAQCLCPAGVANYIM
ncbi:MAG: hypothetical protein R3C53_07015 [Pirellulaceae bacterium]